MVDNVKAGDAVWEIKGDTSHLETAIGKAKSKVSDSVSAMGTLSTKLGQAFTVAGAVIGAGLGIAISKGMEFEQAIANAASVTGKSGEEFEEARKKMEQMALALGERTVFSATQAANAFYDLSSKGFDVASMSLEELQPILDLAAATQFDLAETTQVTTSTLRAFGMENGELSRIADVFTKAIGNSGANMEKLSYTMRYAAPVAKTAGVSFEELVAAASKLYDVGIEGSTAGTMLRSTLIELAAPSKKLIDLLKQKQIRLEEVSLQTHTLSEVFTLFRERGVTAADMFRVFGKEAGFFAVQMLESSNATEEFTGSLLDAGGTAKVVAEQQLDTLQGRLQLLKSAFESIQIKIKQALDDTLQPFVEQVTELLQQTNEWINANEELFASIVKGVAAFGVMASVLGPILIMLPGIVTLVGTIATAFSGWGLAIAAVIGAIAALIYMLYQKFKPSLQEIFASVTDWFKGHLQSIIETLKVWGQVAWNTLKIIGNILATVFLFLSAIVVGAIQEILQAMDVIPEGTKLTFGVFIDILRDTGKDVNKYLEIINEHVTKARDWMLENWDSIKEGTASLVNVIVSALQILTWVLQGAWQFMELSWRIVSSIAQAISWIAQFMPGFGGSSTPNPWMWGFARTAGGSGNTVNNDIGGISININGGNTSNARSLARTIADEVEHRLAVYGMGG